MKQKLFIYQLLPRLIGNTVTTNKINGTIEENGTGKFNDITLRLLRRLKTSGYTHIWYTGIPAHASATDYTAYGLPAEYPSIIKGKAGSPYAIRDYYDVDPDLAVNIPHRMAEFEALIRRTHTAGLKAIIDSIPNHLARNYHSVSKPEGTKDFGEDDDPTHAFSPRNNYYYLPGQALELPLPPGETPTQPPYSEYPARATGNDCFTHKPTRHDWYETVKLNYGIDHLHGKQPNFDPIPDTWIKMRDILRYWADKGIDGFRCDMAEMVPLSFWRWALPPIKAQHPGLIFLAEIYTPAAYRDYLSGNTFDYLYDKVGLYDTLLDVSLRRRPSSDITFTLNSTGDIRHRMLSFMENHDEQRLASDHLLKAGHRGKAAMLVTTCTGTNPVMIYAGQELGERGMDAEGFSGRDGRTTIFDYWSVDTLRRWNNHGRWDSTQLTPEETDLQQFYRRLITLNHREPSLSGGLFYDLMPANYENREFDSTRLYAFLRSDKKDLMLIVANFDDTQRECTIHIPPHAYTFLEITDTGNGRLQPLLQEERPPIPFSPRTPFRITLEPFSGEIYKVTFEK
ncbi:MAG: alpha-amylase [Proteiniphilum sp.]|jgi:glycosidase|nr:alpha-amylase [Proteiniphilum sp.]